MAKRNDDCLQLIETVAGIKESNAPATCNWSLQTARRNQHCKELSQGLRTLLTWL